ncbi:uncharacterized protein LOC144781436 [Lissotriton helveticus]
MKKSTIEKVVTKERIREAPISLPKKGKAQLTKTEELKENDVQDSVNGAGINDLIEEVYATEPLKVPDTVHFQTIKVEFSIEDCLAMKEDVDSGSIADTTSNATEQEPPIEEHVSENAIISTIKEEDVQLEDKDQITGEQIALDDISTDSSVPGKGDVRDLSTTEDSINDLDNGEKGIFLSDAELTVLRSSVQELETAITIPEEKTDSAFQGVLTEATTVDALSETAAKLIKTSKMETVIPSLKIEELDKTHIETLHDEIETSSIDLKISKEVCKQVNALLENIESQRDITESSIESELLEYDISLKPHKLTLSSVRITSSQILEDTEALEESKEWQKEFSPSPEENVNTIPETEMSPPDMKTSLEKHVETELETKKSKKKTIKMKRSIIEKVVTKERSREAPISLPKEGTVELAKTEELKEVDVQDSVNDAAINIFIEEVNATKILKLPDTLHVQPEKVEFSLEDFLAMKENVDSGSMSDTTSTDTPQEQPTEEHVSENAIISTIKEEDVQLEDKDQMTGEKIALDDISTDSSVPGKGDVRDLSKTEDSINDLDKGEKGISLSDAELTVLRSSVQELETAITIPEEKTDSEFHGMLTEATTVDALSETAAKLTKTSKMEIGISSRKMEELEKAHIETAYDEIERTATDIEQSKDVLKLVAALMENRESQEDVTESSRDYEHLEYDISLKPHKRTLPSFGITSLEILDNAEASDESKEELKEFSPSPEDNVKKVLETEMSSPDIQTALEKHVETEVKAKKNKKKTFRMKKSTIEKVVTKERIREAPISLPKEGKAELTKTEELKENYVQDSVNGAGINDLIEEVNATEPLKVPDTVHFQTINVEFSLEDCLAMKEDVDSGSIADTTSNATEQEPPIEEHVSENAIISTIKVEDVQLEDKDQMTGIKIAADDISTDSSVPGKGDVCDLSTTEDSINDLDNGEKGISLSDAELTVLRSSVQELETAITNPEEKTDSAFHGIFPEATTVDALSETVAKLTTTSKMETGIPSRKMVDLEKAHIKTPDNEIRTTSMDIKISEEVLKQADDKLGNIDIPGGITEYSRETEILEFYGSVKLHKFKLPSFRIISSQILEDAEALNESKEDKVTHILIKEGNAMEILEEQDTLSIQTERVELPLEDSLAMKEDVVCSSIADTTSSPVQHELPIKDHNSENARISLVKVEDVQIEDEDQMRGGILSAGDTSTDISVHVKGDVCDLSTTKVSINDLKKWEKDIFLCDEKLTEIRPSKEEQETANYISKENADSECHLKLSEAKTVGGFSETAAELTKTSTMETVIPSIKREELDKAHIETPYDDIETTSMGIKISKEVPKQVDALIKNIESQGDVTESSRESEILQYDLSLRPHKLTLPSFRITSSQILEDAESLEESNEGQKEFSPSPEDNVNIVLETEMLSPDTETPVEKHVETEEKAKKSKKKRIRMKSSTVENVVTKERSREAPISLPKEGEVELSKIEELKEVDAKDSKKDAEEKIVIDEVSLEEILKEPDTSNAKTVRFELSLKDSLTIKEAVDTISSTTQQDPLIEDHVSETARISILLLKGVHMEVKDQMTDGKIHADDTSNEIGVRSKYNLCDISPTEVSINDKSEKGISLHDAELTEISPSEQESETAICIPEEKAESESLGMLIEKTVVDDASETMAELTKILKLETDNTFLKMEELNKAHIETRNDEIKTTPIGIKISNEVLQQVDAKTKNVEFPREVTKYSTETEILDFDGSVKLHKFKLLPFGITSSHVVEDAVLLKENTKEQNEFSPSSEDNVNKEIDDQISSSDIETTPEKCIDIEVKAEMSSFDIKLTNIWPIDQNYKTAKLFSKERLEMKSSSMPTEEVSVNDTSRTVIEQAGALTSQRDIPVFASGEIIKYQKQTWKEELNLSCLPIIKSKEDKKGFILECKNVALAEQCGNALKEPDTKDTEDLIKFDKCILMSTNLATKNIIDEADCHIESREAKHVISDTLTAAIDHKFSTFELQSSENVFFMETPTDTEINATKFRRKITKIKLSSSDNISSEEPSPEVTLNFPFGKEYSMLCKSEDVKNEKDAGHELGGAADINSPYDNISNMNVTKLKTFAFKIKTSREQILEDIALQPSETLENQFPENKVAATLSDKKKEMQAPKGNIGGSHKSPFKFKFQSPSIVFPTSMDDVKQESNTTIEDASPKKTERQGGSDTEPSKLPGWFRFPKIGFSSLWKEDKSADKD